MNKITVIGSIVIVTVFATVFARDLPDFIHVCKKNDPNLSKCITDSVNHLRPYLNTGLPEYNIPALEPFLLKELITTTEENVKLKLRNIKVYGASNFTITKLKSNIDTLNFVVDLDFSNLIIKGEYDVDGQLLLLRIRGSGALNGQFNNCKALVKLQMEMTKGKNGQNYLKLADLQTKIFVGSGSSLKLDNLFGGDPVLGDAINVAINSNFDSFLKEITPIIENAISNTFTDISNSILKQFPYEKLFPES